MNLEQTEAHLLGMLHCYADTYSLRTATLLEVIRLAHMAGRNDGYKQGSDETLAKMDMLIARTGKFAG